MLDVYAALLLASKEALNDLEFTASIAAYPPTRKAQRAKVSRLRAAIQDFEKVVLK